MTTKIILDSRIFHEVEKLGSTRSGMYRVAEDITTHLVRNPEVSVSRRRIFSSSIPKWRGVVRRFSDFYESLNRDLNSNDVYHSFYHPFPESSTSSKIAKSITALDIIGLRLDGYSGELISVTKKIVESCIGNFSIAISEFTRQDLLDYDKRIDPATVFAVPLAASRKLFFQNASKDDWDRVRQKYLLPQNYFLSVSSIDHRKNIPHLIRSFSTWFLQERPSDLHLVLTGNSTYSRAILDDLKIPEEVKSRIFITSRHIDEADLSVVYSNALCFFFMSYYEGFGLPVLEAMQCGTPVVSSNATSLPEVVGEAGILLSPHDQDALCTAMSDMYNHPEKRTQWSRLGLERSGQFSWERCANEYVKIFKNISGKS